MSVPSVFEQTRWKRKGPLSLCDDTSILLKITQYDYELDIDFCKYAQERGIYNFNYSPECFERIRTALLELDDDKYLANDNYHRSINGGLYSLEHRIQFLKSLKMLRGALQDCWEVYKENECF